MNYGEELSYWYLRLNGFFPITNFVIHRSEGIDYRSDYDLVAVRPPHVFEEIGGQPEDWDTFLTKEFEFNQFVGILCEVKTGQVEEKKLFREEFLKTGIDRLGLIPKDQSGDVLKSLKMSAGFKQSGKSNTIGKLLISPTARTSKKYLNLTVEHIENFILEHIEKYSHEKFASRMFFPSPMFQLLIAQNKRGKLGPNN